MNEIWKRAVAIGLTVVGIAVGLVSVLQIFGGLFFGYSFWFYVPPICTLLMFPVAAIERMGLRLVVAYALFGLFILSYVLRNWHDFEIAIRESILQVIVPHVLQFLLCLSVLILVHRRSSS